MDKKKITESWVKHKTKQMAEKVPYHTICSCNPANGGSGMCGCVIANQMVDPTGHTFTTTTTKPFTEWFTVTEPKTQTEIELEEFNEYLHMLADMKSVDLKRKKKLLADYLNNL
jgi:hypothetical protein